MKSPAQPVRIDTDIHRDRVKVSTKPEVWGIVFFVACLIGLVSLPFSAYRHDYMAYAGLCFMLVLSAGYFVTSIEGFVFENKTNIRVRKGFNRWNIPFEAVTGGYTSYNAQTSRQSLQKTHFLSLELKVDLPDNKKHWIRNGAANIFHYGFSRWGTEQEKIWEQLNRILDDNGIPNLTPK